MKSEQMHVYQEDPYSMEYSNDERLSAVKPAAKSIKVRAMAFCALATGALAVGALAVGALAIGRLAIGRLVVGRSKIRKLEIEELDVMRLRVNELQIVGDATAAGGEADISWLTRRLPSSGSTNEKNAQKG